MCDEERNAAIADQTHPNEAFKILKKCYASSLQSNILRLKDDFHAFRLDPSRTVMEIISHLKSIERQLKEAGEQPSKHDYVHRILQILPESWDNVITVWRHNEKMPLDALLENIINEQRIRPFKNSNQTALFSQKRKRNESDDKKSKQAQKERKIYCLQKTGRSSKRLLVSHQKQNLKNVRILKKIGYTTQIHRRSAGLKRKK